METPNALRDLRVAAGLSQEALATAIGCQKTMISKLENGDRRLTPAWVDRISPVLGVDSSALLDGAQPAYVRLGRRNPKPSPTSPGTARLILEIRQEVTPDQAQRIFAILNEGKP